MSSKCKLINLSMEKECQNNAAVPLWEQIFRDVSLVNNNAICVFTVDVKQLNVNLLCANSRDSQTSGAFSQKHVEFLLFIDYMCLVRPKDQLETFSKTISTKCIV